MYNNCNNHINSNCGRPNNCNDMEECCSIVCKPGVQGPTGSTGPQGVQGPTGAVGITGAVGATGPQGDIGATGPQGDIGPTGPQGATGSFDLGDFLFNIVSEGNTVPVEYGDEIIFESSTLDINVTEGSAVVTIENPNITGPTGPQGATGPQGDMGPTGPQGDMGATGPQGDMGATGPQGDMGATGPQGDAGATGPQGDMGPTGPQGDMGATGPQGDVGATGPQGDAGVTGPQGEAGPTGPAGTGGESIIPVATNGSITPVTNATGLLTSTRLLGFGDNSGAIAVSNGSFTLDADTEFVVFSMPYDGIITTVVGQYSTVAIWTAPTNMSLYIAVAIASKESNDFTIVESSKALAPPYEQGTSYPIRTPRYGIAEDLNIEVAQGDRIGIIAGYDNEGTLLGQALPFNYTGSIAIAKK